MPALADQFKMEHERRLWLSFVGLIVMLAAIPAARADIYFWQDDQGVIHFSNQDAPPSASLYMREPEPVEIKSSNRSGGAVPSLADEQVQSKLERANQQIERALERVDELTDKIREREIAAAEAALAARQAAQESIEHARASAATEPVREVRQRVVYHAVPLIHQPAPRLKHHKFEHRNKLKLHRHDLKKFGKFYRYRPNPAKTIRIHYKTKSSTHHRTNISKGRKFR